MHEVSGDRIIESTTGKEVMWRGAGGSYCLHATSLAQALSAWQNLYMPSILAFGFNTMRLAFSFPWEIKVDANGNRLATADNFDFASMDAVVNLLAQNGIKSILDYHGGPTEMFSQDVGGPINPQLIASWQEIANHYKGNENIAAYELYNEPSPAWGPTWRHTPMENAQAYHDISVAVRQIDPDHIIIWETPYHYIPSFSEILHLMLPNVVYTAHRWWTNNVEEIETYGPVELSRMKVDSLIYWRRAYHIPMWLGEFGGPGGGSSSLPYTPTDPHWRICEELLYRCEEQVISWNLWLGAITATQNRLSRHTALFPLKIYNPNLIRQPWLFPNVPYITDYIVASNGVDDITNWTLKMWHNKDSVTLKPGIIIQVTVMHKLADGSFETVTDSQVNVTEPLTITNEEGTPTHPGDWNTVIQVLSYAPQSMLWVRLGAIIAAGGICALVLRNRKPF